MNWIDIASIVFIGVTANHLGLVKAIEDTIHRELKILNCPKCLSWWGVLAYTIITSGETIPSLAISFICSYLAIWLELFEGFIDTLYNKVYEKIYTNASDDEATANTDDGDTTSTVSDVR